MLTALLVLALGLAPADCRAADALRVQRHLLRVEADLRAHPPSALDDAQRAARARNLAHLHDYAVRGVVPKNEQFANPEPFFIDAYGTRCAMAALIEAEGGAEFVQRIARERNNARIRELTDEPVLLAWLKANGMTVEEAARVQPTYFGCTSTRLSAICNEYDGAAQFLVSRIADGGLYGVVEKTCRGDAGLALGSERFLAPTTDLGPFQSEFPPGARVFAQFNGQYGPFGLSPMDADGGIWFIFDRRCAARPSVGWDDATRIFDLSYLDCIGELAKLDPQWSRDFCQRTGAFYDYCFADGGYDPTFTPGFDGGPPPPGPGPIDGGTSDAGAAAGPPPAACGCSSAPVSLLTWLLLVGVGFGRRRREL